MITTDRVTVTAAGVLIADNPAPEVGTTDAGSIAVLVKNLTGTENLIVGGPGVTAATGFPWAPADGPLTVELEPGEELHGVIVTVNQDLAVLRGGR